MRLEVAAIAGADTEGWLTVGCLAGLLIALGVFAIRGALRYLSGTPAR